MLVNERGPFNVFVALREATGITHDTEGVALSWNDDSPLSCLYCTSVWVALVLMVCPMWIKEWLAVSGLAIMVENYGSR
jgi:hypothetical protein